MIIIKIAPDKCTGCRSCEAICSAYHNDCLVNPKRSRIRVFFDEGNDVYVPVIAGPYTDAECNGRNIVVFNGKEYGECSFCRASCPSRELFKEPDAPDIPLKCDRCGEPPPEGGPMCVQWCLNEALTYEEREEAETCKDKEKDKEDSVRYLIEKYGWKDIKDTLDHIAEEKYLTLAPEDNNIAFPQLHHNTIKDEK